MKFCEKCGNLLVTKPGKKVPECRKCGKKGKPNEKIVIAEEHHEHKKGVVVMGKDEQQGDLPVTHIMCPECEHGEAFWWMQQTRSADEPPTLFYRCKKCAHSWRSYG